MRNLPTKAIIGMIHTLALPGSPYYGGDIKNVIDRAVEELKIYEESGLDAVMLENMYDLPYIKPPLPKDTIEGMLAVTRELRQRTELPIGIQMLEGADLEAFEIAAKADLDFIRVESFVFAHIGAAGLIEGSAGALFRLRKKLKAEHIKIFADIKKKQRAHAIMSDLTFKDVVKQTEFFRADGIVITAGLAGDQAKPADLLEIKSFTKLPILIGSGITAENINEYLPTADGFIVGSYFKVDDKWQSPVDPQRVKKLLDSISR